MAESVISIVAGKLGYLLFQEVIFLKGVRGQVASLVNELERMQGFLKDADTKQEGDERVRIWVSQIRNAAYEAEDIIDAFILKVESQKKADIFRRSFHIFKEVADRRKVGKKIELLNLDLRGISESRMRYGINNSEASSIARERLRHIRRSSPLGEALEKDLVGLQNDKDKLVAQLLKMEDRFVVISIVGMGGIGKTTLAKSVFNHRDVIDNFHVCCWVHVSQSRSKDVLQTIIRQVTGEMVESSHEELERMLYEHLQQKCYLVVLDDMWTTGAWDVLERAFPKTNNGSKLLLTTRNRDVAEHVAVRADAKSIVHDLKLLSTEDSWNLFSKKAFIDEVDCRCPPELEQVARRILGKCAGLPLSIVVIGGLLYGKIMLSEWMRVLDNINLHFAEPENGVLSIIALSYSDLPHYLKPCFLHLGVFPQGYVISTQKLIRLWIAEGLIDLRVEKSPESTAEGYLNELVNGNMVQVVRTSANNRIKECQIHDLLRDLCIDKAKTEIFLEIHRGTNFQPSETSRHQAVYSDFERYFQSRPSIPSLRSLLLFYSNVSELEFFSHLNTICTNFTLLRVLDLENIWVYNLPTEIGQLFNLRYLGLRNTQINELPSSMRYLQNLQTLDISQSNIFHQIPNVICKMGMLRHLFMDPLRCAGQLRIDTLSHLQTLLWVHVDNWKHKDSENLRSLLKLGVLVSLTSDVDQFFNSISKLEQLSTLYLVSDHEFRNRPSLAGLSRLTYLTKLRLVGPMRKLPQSIEFPPQLTQLTLIQSRLYRTAMSTFAELPKLSVLILRDDSYIGEQLKISATWFPLLQLLELKGLSKLEEVTVENDAMPRLRRFRILSCPRLTNLHLNRTDGSVFLVLEIADTRLQLNEVPSRVGIYECSPRLGDQ